MGIAATYMSRTVNVNTATSSGVQPLERFVLWVVMAGMPLHASGMTVKSRTTTMGVHAGLYRRDPMPTASSRMLRAV